MEAVTHDPHETSDMLRDHSPLDSASENHDSTEGRRQPIRRASAVIGILLAAFAGLFVWGRSDGATQASPAVGKIVPELKGETLEGDRFDVDALRGRWVVVNLFATWCVPCQVEHPELVAFAQEHSDTGDVALVSVVFGDQDDDVRRFFDERGGDWPVLGTEYSSVVVDFGATGVPETYIVAPNGVVVERILGGVTQALLNSVIDKYR